MKSVTLQATSIEDIKKGINNAISDDFKPSLAIAFASVSQDLKELSEIFQENDIKLFGASSSGEIAENEVFEQSIVLMLLDMKKENFSIYSEAIKDNNVYDVAKNAAIFAKEKYSNPAMLVVSSGLTVDGVSIVEGIIGEIGENISLFGGMSGDDLRMEKTFVFTNNTLLDEGLVFLVIDNDKVEVGGMATSGWEAVGIEKTVTKSEGNIIYEIDNRPALDIFMEYYGITDANVSGVSIGTKYPLQVKQEGKEPVLRTPLLINEEDNSLIFAGRIEQGSKVKFSVQPTFEIIDTTVENFKAIHNQSPEADALVMFSCAGRHIAFGPMMEDEVEGIKEIWDAPVVGLFTYGEIGNTANGTSNFHNETCSLVILKEK